MAETLVYALTNGNAGTGYLHRFLEANLKGAECHADRAGWLDLGVNCPDASHLTRFNTLGNEAEVRAFWRRKFARDADSAASTLVDLTHLHAKAGLVENLSLLGQERRVVLVHLQYDIAPTVWLIHNRCDYRNSGFSWIFGLDPNYRNVIVPSGQFAKFGMAGLAYWYVVEMRVRAAYYKRLVADIANVAFVEIHLNEVIGMGDAQRRLLKAINGEDGGAVFTPDHKAKPEKRPGGQKIEANTAAAVQKDRAAGDMFGEDVKQQVAAMLQNVQWDAEVLAEAYWQAGRRLGNTALGQRAVGAVH